MIWALLALIALAVVGALIWPLIRDASEGDFAGRDVVVLKDQLTELDRDVARGVISTTEAEVLRVEIQRRLLAAARRPALASWREGPGLRSGLTALLAVAVPLFAFAIYMNLGAPTLQSTAPRAQQAEPRVEDKEMAGLVEQLAARMANEPDNIEGWTLLARSYRQVERYADALEAYRHVLSLNPPDAEAYSNFGEMAVTVGGGNVPPDAAEAFFAALQRDREDPRARFYLGLAAAQNNDPNSAIAYWRDLTASSPPDAPWLEMVRNQMFQVAQSAAVMPMSVEPRHPLDGKATPPAAPAQNAPSAALAPQPADPDDITSPDVSAIQTQFSDENLAQIQAMVGSLAGRLENEPNDYNGWLMLGRSYIVLRNAEGAKNAFEKAMALKPGELGPKLSYASVLISETNLNSPAPLPAKLVKTSDDILKIAPDHPEALFVRGLAAFKTGDKKTAERDWAAARKTAQGQLASEIDSWMKALN